MMLIKQPLKIILINCLLLFSAATFANAKTLNIYGWAGYIPQQVIKQFERQTGINVNFTGFDNNETLYAKLKTDQHVGYDIIMPSSYYVARMREQGLLLKLDKTKLVNLHYLNPLLLHRAFDPDNNYSLPYLWGSTGIVVNDKYYRPKTITSWQDFWQPRFHNKLLILDDVRSAFSIALITLGYSINDTNPKHIYQAYLQLKKLRPNIKLFNAEAPTSIYADEDAVVGVGWSGDIYLATLNNKHIKFIYPKDGFIIWIDCVAIAKYAPHVANAYKFLNFIMRPKIAEQISLLKGYSSPNLAAMQLLPKKIRNNHILNPPATILQRGQVQNSIGNARSIYAKYWQMLKLGE